MALRSARAIGGSSGRLRAFTARLRADGVPASLESGRDRGVVPDPCGGTLAAAASRIYRAPYGLVFQDLVGQAAEQSGVAGGARVAGLVRSLELGPP